MLSHIGSQTLRQIPEKPLICRLHFQLLHGTPSKLCSCPLDAHPAGLISNQKKNDCKYLRTNIIYVEREREKLIDIERERETEIWSIENRQLATNGVQDWANRKTGSTHGTCASCIIWLHDYWFKVQRSASRITKQTGFFMCLSLCTILQHFKQHTWTLEESTVAGGALSPWHHAQDQEHKGTSGPGTCINRPQKRHKAWFE